MRWFGTLQLRLLLFGGIAWSLGCCLTVDDPNIGPTLFRAVLWIAAVITMFVDWSLLNRRILEYQKAFTTCAETAPPRWEKFTHSFRGLALFGVIWLPIQCVRADEDTDPLAMLVGVALLTVTCALWWTLVLGGFTWLRYRIKGRLIPKDMRPSGRPPAPWAVAALMAPVLWLVFFGATGVAVLAVLGAELVTLGDDRVELLVELGPDDSIGELSGTLAVFAADAEIAFPSIDPSEDADLDQTWLVEVPRSTAAGLLVALALSPEDVDNIELNSVVSAGDDTGGRSCTPSLLASSQYRAVQPELVAVIDTGVDSTHPGLWGVVMGDSSDRRGHGTAVAGLIGGRLTSANGGGAVRVRSYPALSSERATIVDVVEAMDEAIEDGAAVINMSFGSVGAAPKAMREAVEYADREGALVVTSAGNRGPTGLATEQWPANVPGVVVVGATDASGRVLSSSSRVTGMSNAVLVPGEELCTTVPGGGYEMVTGTSFATGVVSGQLGMLAARGCRVRAGEIAGFDLADGPSRCW